MPRRTADDRVKLLHGPYRAPRLRVGDRATCWMRDCDVVVTSGTDAGSSRPKGCRCSHFLLPRPRRQAGKGFAAGATTSWAEGEVFHPMLLWE